MWHRHIRACAAHCRDVESFKRGCEDVIDGGSMDMISVVEEVLSVEHALRFDCSLIMHSS